MPNMLNDENKIYLKVEHSEDEEDTIDLMNVASHMGKKKKLYGYLMLLAVFAGLLIGLVVTGVKYLTGNSAYARAVITFQFEGIEDGLDPNGASFDINKLKAPVVIQAALDELGITDISVEDIRQNITIEGVIPEDAVERITVINQMAEEDATYYEKILDVSYYPSQYIVYLYKNSGMSGSETSELLDAVLTAYKDWFLDTYANTEVLTMTGNLINYDDYDYVEAVDLVASQIDIMQDYVDERYEDAPDFRSANTGLSFGDIQTSLSTIESIDLASLQSLVESANLSKDADTLREYYNYNIKEYTFDLTELQTQLTTVQNSIDSYEKDPVVIVSSQDSTQEIEQTNEYYDELVAQKLTISNKIASVNTKLNKTYTLLNCLDDTNRAGIQADYDRADELLASITATLTEWTTRIEETTDEYYSTTLFSNAYKISVPAQYQSAGLMSMAKTFAVCIGAALLVVIFIWCMDGLVYELKKGECNS